MVYRAAPRRRKNGAPTLGNGVVTNRSFDSVTGWLNTIQSGVSGGTALQNQSYAYDKIGNVTQRQENTLGLTENFYYDNLYRLDYSQLGGVTNLDLTYDAMGNITARSDVNGGNTWAYHGTKKHAVANTGSGGATYTYDNNGNMTSRDGQTIRWASFNYPAYVSTATENATFLYGPDRQYYRQEYNGPSSSETTYYVGGLLEKVCPSLSCSSGTIDWRHYIVAEGQIVAIISRKSTGTNSVSYLLEDNQGSGSTLANSSGTLLVRESFNAYGLRRDGSDWDGAAPSGDLTTIEAISRRGYTGHSMLGRMGLTHMNGRVQDAITGRFLSPDPYVPYPSLTQSFNRYSYVRNNPLTLVDPSGFMEPNPDPAQPLDEILVLGDVCASNSVPIERRSYCEQLARLFNNMSTAELLCMFKGRIFCAPGPDVASSPGQQRTNTAHSGERRCVGAGCATVPQSQKACYAPPISPAEQQASDRGDRRSFWASRESRGDPMGGIGMAVVNDTGLGREANARLFEALAVRDFYVYKKLDTSVASTRAEMNQIGVDIMRAHVNVVNTYGTANAVQVADYHFQVFGRHDLPANTFGGAPFFGTRLEARISSPLWLNCQ